MSEREKFWQAEENREQERIAREKAADLARETGAREDSLEKQVKAAHAKLAQLQDEIRTLRTAADEAIETVAATQARDSTSSNFLTLLSFESYN